MFQWNIDRLHLQWLSRDFLFLFFFFFFFFFLQAVTAFGSILEWTRKKGDRASGSQLAREDGLSIQLPDEVRIKSHHTSSSALSIPELPVVSHNWFTSWLFLPSTALTSFLGLSSLSPAVYLHLSVFISLVAAMKNVMKQSSIFFFLLAIHVFRVIYTSLCRKAHTS